MLLRILYMKLNQLGPLPRSLIVVIRFHFPTNLESVSVLRLFCLKQILAVLREHHNKRTISPSSISFLWTLRRSIWRSLWLKLSLIVSFPLRLLSASGSAVLLWLLIHFKSNLLVISDTQINNSALNCIRFVLGFKAQSRPLKPTFLDLCLLLNSVLLIYFNDSGKYEGHGLYVERLANDLKIGILGRSFVYLVFKAVMDLFLFFILFFFLAWV